MEFWIARDKDNSLWLFDILPIRSKYSFIADTNNCAMELNNNLFQEVTWENSPRKVKIEIL